MEKDEFDKAIESLDKVSDSLKKTVELLDEASNSLDEASDSLEELIQTHIDFYKEIYRRVLMFFIYLIVLGIVSIIAMMSIY